MTILVIVCNKLCHQKNYHNGIKYHKTLNTVFRCNTPLACSKDLARDYRRTWGRGHGVSEVFRSHVAIVQTCDDCTSVSLSAKEDILLKNVALLSYTCAHNGTQFLIHLTVAVINLLERPFFLFKVCNKQLFTCWFKFTCNDSHGEMNLRRSGDFFYSTSSTLFQITQSQFGTPTRLL